MCSEVWDNLVDTCIANIFFTVDDVSFSAQRMTSKLTVKKKKSSVQPGGPVWSAAGSGELGWSHACVSGRRRLTDSGL